MRNSRADVVEKAIAVLDAHGLADLSMRRLGAELGVQPSALYHHFATKQLLLAAVADEILARGARPVAAGDWADRVAGTCHALRDAMLAYRDGAELVATVHAFGLGARAPYDALVVDLTPLAARTLLHFVLGHVVDEQTQLQAGSAGAIDGAPRESSDFGLGLAIVLDGIRAQEAAQTANVPPLRQ
jgi:TetR/AcrR family transcriptional regulator, tetracycline repressor protein